MRGRSTCIAGRGDGSQNLGNAPVELVVHGHDVEAVGEGELVTGPVEPARDSGIVLGAATAEATLQLLEIRRHEEDQQCFGDPLADL